MATIMDFVQDQLKEELSPGLRESLPELDPVMGRLYTDFTNVTREGIGRDWKVIHTFDNTGVTGISYTVQPNGGTILANGDPGTNGFSLMGGSQMDVWPTADQMPTNSFLRRTLALKKTITSCPIPMTLNITDQLPGVGSMVDSILKGFIRQINMLKINAFWKLANTDSRILEATIGGTTIPTTGTTFTITSGRISNIYNGMAVYVRPSATSSTPKTNESDAQPCFIDSVDYRAKTFIVKAHPSASAIATFTLNESCYIYRWRPNYQSAPDPTVAATAASLSGLEDWLIDDATSTVYGIDFAKYHQFRSWKTTSYSGALSSSALNKEFGGFMEAYGMDKVDTLLTTDGVFLGLIDNIESTQQLLRYEVQGQATDVKLGTKSDKLSYQCGAKRLEVIQTKHAPKGIVYGLKLGNNNIKHYVPPPLPKKGSQSGHSQEVEFIGKAIGYASNVVPLPASSSDASTTNGTHLPAQFYCEIVPDQLQGIRMGTFEENI